MYIGISLLPLRFVHVLLVHILIFFTYLFFYTMLLMARIIPLDRQAEVPNINSLIVMNCGYQLLIVLVVNVQAYISERESRYNCLQLHLMLEQELFLNKEKKKNENLLTNMLPVEILQKMKHKEELIFSFPSVTVLFCQICDFPQIVSFLPPQKVVQLLNIIYSAFDRVVETHSVYKVETVAEVYMAVSGCPTPVSNHAVLAANAALEMRACLPSIWKKIEKEVGYIGVPTLQIRIGLNSGPIVAGVIGSSNPRYKLFGDTVNTASRMESTCEKGKIQCSPTTEELLRDSHDVIVRGVIDVKGKGGIKVFYINSQKGSLDCTAATVGSSASHSTVTVATPEVVLLPTEFKRRNSGVVIIESSLQGILDQTNLDNTASMQRRRIASLRVKLSLNRNHSSTNADDNDWIYPPARMSIKPRSSSPSPSKNSEGEAVINEDDSDTKLRRSTLGSARLATPSLSKMPTYNRIFEVVDNKEFALPKEYDKFWRSTFFPQKDSPSEAAYLRSYLPSILNTIRFSLIIATSAMAFEQVVRYLDPTVSLATNGNSVDSTNINCTTESAAMLKDLNKNFKYGISAPLLVIGQ
jgi:class 3 adenylate cyclase